MRLALALARDQMPVPASMVLRVILESRKLPDVDMLSMSFLHMLKSQVGSCLATDVLIEACENFLDQVKDNQEMKKLDQQCHLVQYDFGVMRELKMHHQGPENNGTDVIGRSCGRCKYSCDG